MCLFSAAALTMHHILGGLGHSACLIPVLMARESKSKCLQVLAPFKALASPFGCGFPKFAAVSLRFHVFLCAVQTLAIGWRFLPGNPGRSHFKTLHVRKELSPKYGSIPRLWGWDMQVPFEGHPSTQLQ